MAKRSGHPVHGWVNLDKPRGISSAKAVAIVRRVFDAAKAGHGGTLDPLASGVLPIALGEATKTVFFRHGGQRCGKREIGDGQDQVVFWANVLRESQRVAFAIDQFVLRVKVATTGSLESKKIIRGVSHFLGHPLLEQFEENVVGALLHLETIFTEKPMSNHERQVRKID